MTLLRWKLRRGSSRAAGKKLFSCNAFHEARESFKALRASLPKAVRGIARTFCGACSHLTRCVFSRWGYNRPWFSYDRPTLFCDSQGHASSQHRKMSDNKTHEARSPPTIRYAVTIFVRVVRYVAKYCGMDRKAQNKQPCIFAKGITYWRKQKAKAGYAFN